LIHFGLKPPVIALGKAIVGLVTGGFPGRQLLSPALSPLQTGPEVNLKAFQLILPPLELRTLLSLFRALQELFPDSPA
jgi:hypothetical protein